MSSHRLVFTFGVVVVALAAGSWKAISAFPLTFVPETQTATQSSPGPLEQRAHPITPENPIPRRVIHQAPAYPDEARSVGASGTVTLMITLDELGRVAETRQIRLSVGSTNPSANVSVTTTNPADAPFLVNGSKERSDALRAIAVAFSDAAVRAVRQWRYDPPAVGPIAFPVTVNFADAGMGTGVPSSNALLLRGDSTQEAPVRVGGNVKTPRKTRHVSPAYPAEAFAAGVSGMVILEARIGRDGAVEDAQVLRSIPLLDQAAVDAVMQWQFTPTLLNGVPVPVIMTVTVNFTREQRREVTPDAQAPAVELSATATRSSASGTSQEPVRVGSRIIAPKKIYHVDPVHPPIAAAARVRGMVIVEVRIGKDGAVENAKVLRSIPLLDQAAIDAVIQWRFTPTLLNGQPVPVVMTVTVNFTTETPREVTPERRNGE